MNGLMILLPLLLAFASFDDPSPRKPEARSCLIAHVYLPQAGLDDTARTALDRAMDRAGSPATTVLIYASGTLTPDGRGQSEQHSAERGAMIRDYLIAQGVPTGRIRVVAHREGLERFGDPGYDAALVLIQYSSRIRLGVTADGRVHPAMVCSTVVRPALP